MCYMLLLCFDLHNFILSLSLSISFYPAATSTSSVLTSRRQELERQIEQQRSSERALSAQAEDQEKEMGDKAILSPEQEEAALRPGFHKDKIQ